MGNIQTVQNRCVGCRSCEQNCPKQCISMEDNKEGFWYPTVSTDICVDCGKCLEACPAENLWVHRNQPLDVWAVRNKNVDDIMKSASGGASDIAARIILSQGGVVYGAAYDDELAVCHIEISDEKDGQKIQSSKYVQSNSKDCYSRAKKQLADGKTVLFTGTPCQIAGLYCFLGGDKPNLYTMDLICHGVPSPKFFRKYLEYQNKKMNGKIYDYNFRSKTRRGWGTQCSLKIKTKTKTKALALDRYGRHFMDGDCYRESCYICPYANTDRVGDITMGDFWGIGKSHPDFYSPKGVSSVFVNTDKGRRLFEHMKEQAVVQKVTLEEGLAKQGNLVKPSPRPGSRDKFYEKIDENYFMDDVRVGLQPVERIKAALPANVVRRIKNILGADK